jgi:hypothetical protein
MQRRSASALLLSILLTTACGSEGPGGSAPPDVAPDTAVVAPADASAPEAAPADQAPAVVSTDSAGPVPDSANAPPEPGDAAEAEPPGNFIKATINGAPIVFDTVTRHQAVGRMVFVTASAPALHKTIDIYLYEAKSRLPASSAVDTCDVQGNSRITLTDESGPTRKISTADDRSAGSMCEIDFSVFTFERLLATFSATLVGDAKLVVTGGIIDVPGR